MVASRFYGIDIAMRKNRRRRLVFAICLTFAFRMCACSQVSQSPFAGNWKIDPDRSEFSTMPFTFSLSNGRYDCASCAPAIHQIKADGSEQPVTGLLGYKVAVNEIDVHSLRIVETKEGKIFSEEICSVADSARTLHCKTTAYSNDDKRPLVAEADWERIGEPVPNANAASGSWRMRTWVLPGDQSIETFEWNGSELSASLPYGSRWAAKFDGKDYPVKGSSTVNSVSLKKMSDQQIEATYKFGRQLIRVDRMTVSSDGQTLTTTSEHKQTGRTDTVVATRQ